MANVTVGGLNPDEFVKALPAMPKALGRTHYLDESDQADETMVDDFARSDIEPRRRHKSRHRKPESF